MDRSTPRHPVQLTQPEQLIQPEQLAQPIPVQLTQLAQPAHPDSRHPTQFTQIS
ncbi:hypothetical protein DENSPDRAFT_841010 [Dentipellis sp. KUC8613]|nr:hypothetical protein DENSPDRAFT_841010 [Dentipellis sp. KUC8613]